jgi:nicotinate-nucleotide--dimethylbenzimidazole phosphoribosyltransferase
MREDHSLPAFLAETVNNIAPPDQRLLAEARAYADSLTKPPGSLGRLEELAIRLYALQAGKTPLMVDPARLFTVGADHGVVEEGVSSAPQEVTRLQMLNFLAGGGGINAMCRASGIELVLVDAGVLGGDFAPRPNLVRGKIRQGTANLAKAPAMSREECLRALGLGLELAEQAAGQGCRCLGTGEMGIGNTTPSTALFCAWLGFSPEEVTGPGAGVPAVGLDGKAAVVRRALDLHRATRDTGDPVAVLAALGGLEIAVLAGIILGGAGKQLPVVIDGFIATAAFAAALQLAPHVGAYCFFGHASAETGHKAILEKLGQRPLLDLDLRLGEGTGAALAIPLLRAAACMFNDMSTFAQAGIVL